MDVTKTIADAIHAELLKIDGFHFGSPGIMLFKDGKRVGTIDMEGAITAAIDALAAGAEAKAA